MLNTLFHSTESFEEIDPVLAAVNKVVNTQLQPLVERIDREGCYPKAVMHALGSAGAYRSVVGADANFKQAIAAMSDISSTCMSTGFMTWCQDVCGLYIDQSGNQALIDRRLIDHVSGKTLGGTGMSNPMKALANIETLLLKGEKVAGGYCVNGTLPWVSNIGAGHYLGGVFQVNAATSHEVMFLLECDAPGVLLKRCPVFSGMEGTGTYSVRMTNVFVPEENIIADPMRPFIAKIRAAFVLLQCGMGMGVIQGAIDSCYEVEDQLGHVNEFLHDRPDELQSELNELTQRVNRLAASPYDGSKEHMIDTLDVRAHCSELSLKASQSALLHQGARGYLMTAAPQRRIREAHFVAIVTPALKHLRKEIARLSAPSYPA
jgi:alkylation response protein AidB-like acyl-CoA dehydrogenase